MLQDIRKCFAVVAALVIALFLLFSTNAFAQIYTWHTKAAMPTARFGLASGAVNGIVYAVGGVAGGLRLALGALQERKTNRARRGAIGYAATGNGVNGD